MPEATSHIFFHYNMDVKQSTKLPQGCKTNPLVKMWNIQSKDVGVSIEHINLVDGNIKFTRDDMKEKQAAFVGL